MITDVRLAAWRAQVERCITLASVRVSPADLYALLVELEAERATNQQLARRLDDAEAELLRRDLADTVDRLLDGMRPEA